MDSIDSPPAAVSVSLRELEDGSVSLESLEQAFGPNSLGIILVKDLPARFVGLRRKLLSLSSYLANLPGEELVKLEKADAKYAVGWSCGKETLANGRYDTSKGSYYAQPVHNAELEAKARQLYPGFPEMTSSNVWPEQGVLPGFGETFEDLCHLIIDVAGYVARSCDRYGVAKLEGYRDGVLEGIVRNSVSTKARLLHYFPPPPPSKSGREEEGSTPARLDETPSFEDDWCAIHHDLGALTGLTSQMFIDEAVSIPKPTSLPDGTLAFSPLPELPHHPDPHAGLWIKDRLARTTQVHIPGDCLAFQTGQALQLITRGKFRAVPHYVRGARPGKAGRIARNTLAVFTQPNLWDVVDVEHGRTFAELARETLAAGL